MTWDDLACIIARMPERERRCEIGVWDTGRGEFMEALGVEAFDLTRPEDPERYIVVKKI